MIDPLLHFFSAVLNIYASLPQPFHALVGVSVFLGIILTLLKFWRYL